MEIGIDESHKCRRHECDTPQALDGNKLPDVLYIWLNSFIFVIADNVQYRYKTQQYHTKHEDKMALVTTIS